MLIADVRRQMAATLSDLRAIPDAIDAQAAARDHSVAAAAWIERFASIRAAAIIDHVTAENLTVSSAAAQFGMSRRRLKQIIDNHRWTSTGTTPTGDPLTGALVGHLHAITGISSHADRAKAAHTALQTLMTYQQALKHTRSTCAAFVTATNSCREAGRLLDMPHQRVHRYATAAG